MIESLSSVGLIRTVDTVAISRSWTRARQIAVPDLIGILRQFDPLELGHASFIEQTDLDLGRV